MKVRVLIQRPGAIQDSASVFFARPLLFFVPFSSEAKNPGSFSFASLLIPSH